MNEKISNLDVFGVIKNRRDNLYQPHKNITDKFKIGLVIEGGGMRGVISCGMVDALYQLGFGECFDAVYGTSAGAINAAYFLSGQMPMGTSIYYDDISNKDFINLRRWPEIMSLDYLFNIMSSGKKKLDTQKVLNSQTDFTITTTDTQTGEAVWHHSSNLSEIELMKALKASSSTPLFTDNTELLDGRYLNDGMLHDAIPLRPALEDNCTHILCLLTREAGFRKKSNVILELFEHFRLKNYNKSYQKSYFSRQSKYNDTVDMIEGITTPEINTFISFITPTEIKNIVSNGEIKRNLLYNAAKAAMGNVINATGSNDHKLTMYSAGE